MSPPRILFVCTGNICRSPLAEAMLRHEAEKAGIDVVVGSAGTSEEEVGNPPDRRACQVAARHGLTLPERAARQVTVRDFYEFDLILPMTEVHRRALQRLAPPDATARMRLFMEYAPEHGVRDVPDPWYGGMADFEAAHRLIAAGVAGILASLRPRATEMSG